jgi:hypothetical protein
MPDAKIAESAITRLTVREAGVQTKIEVTPVLRSCVYEPGARAVSDKVEAEPNRRRGIHSSVVPAWRRDPYAAAFD